MFRNHCSGSADMGSRPKSHPGLPVACLRDENGVHQVSQPTRECRRLRQQERQQDQQEWQFEALLHIRDATNQSLSPPPPLHWKWQWLLRWPQPAPRAHESYKRNGNNKISVTYTSAAGATTHSKSYGPMAAIISISPSKLPEDDKASSEVVLSDIASSVLFANKWDYGNKQVLSTGVRYPVSRFWRETKFWLHLKNKNLLSSQIKFWFAAIRNFQGIRNWFATLLRGTVQVKD